MATALAENDVEIALDRFLADYAGAATTLTTILGLRLGVYAALSPDDPRTAAEIAVRAGIPADLATEWLKAQVVAGHVIRDSATERYSVSDATRAVVDDPVAGDLLRGLGSCLVATAQDLPVIEQGYRTGTGVHVGDRSPGIWEGQHQGAAATEAPLAAGVWIPQLSGIAARLAAGGRVADVGCGFGSPALAIAQAYPAARVCGFDAHDVSVISARALAEAAGVSDRVGFEVADAHSYPGSGYDLVTFFDALHDMGDPVGVLEHVRSTLAPDGAVLLVEFPGGDRLEDDTHTFGRMMHAVSALICTPTAVNQGGGALGTLAGERALRSVAERAGFSRVRRLESGTPFNLVLELRR